MLKNLRILRKKAKLTQSKLAKMLHVDRQVIYKYEKGINQASFDTLLKMSEIFDIPVEYLINDERDIESYIDNICKKLIEIERSK